MFIIGNEIVMQGDEDITELVTARNELQKAIESKKKEFTFGISWAETLVDKTIEDLTKSQAVSSKLREEQKQEQLRASWARLKRRITKKKSLVKYAQDSLAVEGLSIERLGQLPNPHAAVLELVSNYLESIKE